MQISKTSTATGAGQATAVDFSGGATAATAALNDTTGAASVDQQLGAYHALSNRWAGAGHGERAALTQALTDSPFAKTVQSALNTFTRAAWAGSGAAPPAPQERAKAAFEGLSETDQKIVASLQVGVQGSPPPASVDDYRARLQSDLDAAQAPDTRSQDTVTLSPEARARLAGGAAEDSTPPPTDATPEMAAAISAYGKAAG
jgi:hypothetical protein